ncbi:MAG: sigma-70 family RNA polymerase sigma factor [Clostridiales bacterium]|nr:sigma-70 family RNA polymerase sigma factor [Clostridiales bacterium]
MKNISIKEMEKKLKIFYNKFPTGEVINFKDAKNYLIKLFDIDDKYFTDDAVYSFLKKNGYKNIDKNSTDSSQMDFLDLDLESILELDFDTIDDSSSNINITSKYNRKSFNNNKNNIQIYSKTNNPKILEELLINNKSLVVKYVNIYKKLLLSSSSLDTSDLEQAGMIGLHKAIEKFDSNKPYEFSTYAVWWIKQSILREIMNNANVVRIPVHVHEKIMKIHKLESESIIKYGYVDINSICTQMDIDEERYNSLKMIDFKFNKIKSLDCYISNDEDEDTPMIYFITASNTLNNISLDFSDPNEIIDKKLFKEDILNSLDCLTEKERNVILMRFGFLDGEIHTLEEIGTIYKVTRERIRQIENKALKKLFRSHYMQEIYKQYTIA